ncbi:cytokinesis protein 3 [Blyttiomyces sp. JEL0837]|nr:cytokinesis protein 3 [Blyttiomyces sp. JEL0837]
MAPYSVRVDHAASQQRIKIDVNSTSTLNAFLAEIAAEMNLDPSSITLFYMDDSFRVKVKVQDGNVTTTTTTTNVISDLTTTMVVSDPILIKVTYDNVLYAIEIKSPSLDEFNNQLCKQFALDKHDLESMHLVHNSIVITSDSIFVRVLKSCGEHEKTEAEFLVRPKSVIISKQSSEAPNTPMAVTLKPLDVADYETFDVMLSYEWSSGKYIVIKIKQELERRGLRVWFDEEQMHANMYERMAEAITKSSVVSPLLTVAYTESANCKRELSYAGDLKKQLQPTCAVAPSEKLEPWAELVTAGLFYYDFHNCLTDSTKFPKSVDALFGAIQISINEKRRDVDNLAATNVQPEEPLLKWLQPVDFDGDLAKFKTDYVEGTSSTMPFQLASKLPDFQKFLIAEMAKDKAKVAKGETSTLDIPSTAFKELIVNGLNQIQKPVNVTNLVFVVDALDEIGKKHNLKGHTKSVVIPTACFAKDGLLTASSGGSEVIVWNVRNGTALTTLPANRVLSFSSDSRLLATTSADNRVTLWDVASSNVAKELFGHREFISSACFSSTGTYVATAGYSGIIWDVASGTETRRCQGHVGHIDRLEFSVDDQRLISVSLKRCQVKEWNICTGEAIRSMKGPVFKYLSKFGLAWAYYGPGSYKIFTVFIINNRFAICSE